MKKFYLVLLLTMTLSGVWGQTTYTWNHSVNNEWTTAPNWTPARNTPANNDILVFNDGSTTTPINIIVSETIGQMLISGNTTLNFNPSVSGLTFTIGGGSGTDLSVAAGSTLNIGGLGTATLTLASGATASISGNMTLSGAAHKLDAADANAITFNSPAIFTQGTGCTGNVFTNAGTANAIVFASGSTFAQFAGANPFGFAQPSSKVVFQTGSLFKMQQNSAPSFSGRTYANLEINSSAFSQSAVGANTFTLDNLTIADGTLNINLTGIVNIKGNISVATGEVLTFNPASAAPLNLNGTLAQTISNSGTLTFGANESVVIGNAAGVTFNNSQTLAGNLTVSSGAILATSGTLAANGGTNAINGTFRINQGGFASGTNFTYGAGATLIFNNSAGTFVVNNDVYWPASNGPTNVTVAGAGGIQMNVARTVAGTFQYAAGVAGANNLTLNGIIQINNGGYVSGSPTLGGSSTLIYNSGGNYGRNGEWLPNATSGAGYPTHVQLSNNTTLDLANGSGGVSFQCGGNLTIDAGSNLRMDLAPAMTQPLTVSGNLIVSGILTLSTSPNGDLNVKGDLTTSLGGNLIHNNRMITFNGSGLQYWSNSNGQSYGFVTINKSGNVVTLVGSNVTIGTLTLTAGKIDLSSLNLVVDAVSGGSSSSYVITSLFGYFKRTNVGNIATVFPVGPDATLYHPVTITNSGTVDNFGVTVLSFDPPCAPPSKSVTTTWDITEDVAGGSNCTLSLTYTGSATGGSYNSAAAQIIHCAGLTADYHNGSVTGTTATGSGFTSFSPFGVTSDPVTLPVNFVNVKASQQSTGIKIDWSNATETDMNNYSIGRSANGNNFSPIGTITARSNNGGKADYSFVDLSPLPGINFYRVHAISYNNSDKYSSIVKVDMKSAGTGITIYPNPVMDRQVSLQATGLIKGQYTIRVFDANGRQVLNKLLDHHGGAVTEVIQLPATIDKGVYNIQVSGGEVKLSKTFIVQ